MKVLGPNHNGNMFYFQMPQHIHFFSRVRNWLKMTVSVLNHLPGRVKTSDLVQSGRDTNTDVVEGLTINHDNITLGTSLKYSFGHLEASWVPLPLNLRVCLSFFEGVEDAW